MKRLDARGLTTRLRRASVALAVGAAGLTGALAPASPASADPPALPNENAYGITTTDYREVDPAQPRLLNVKMRTGNVYQSGAQFDVQVRILLPAGYNPAANTRYPVLYLLHGGAADWAQWSGNGVTQAVDAAQFEGIVVMPEGGSTGYYTNWHGLTDGGYRPNWENFHIDQLVPWIDANYKTQANRDNRSIAGPSMGGFGALKYAGQHPDMFGAVGSFSGATDLAIADDDPRALAVGGSANVRRTISDHMVGMGACIRPWSFWPPDSNCWDGSTRVNLKRFWPPVSDEEQQTYRMRTLFGPPNANGRYPNVSPYDMASQFTAYSGRLALYSGGMNASGDDIHASAGERDMGLHNLVFRQRLNSLGIDHEWCVDNTGHGDFAIWRRDLTDFLHLVQGRDVACHRNPSLG
jgi:S-formylglutathione hydrolase FrmB